MQNSIFSQIRKQHFAQQLFMAVMTNLMVLSPTLTYAMNSGRGQYIPSVVTTYYNQHLFNLNQFDKMLDSVKTNQQPVDARTTTVKTVSLGSVSASNEVSDSDTILSIEKQGIIGKSENLPIDEVTDNIFSFELKSDVKKDKDIYLEYELFGLADGSQTTKSINDQFALGGSIIKTTKEWVKVKERVDPSNIQKGKNTVSFTTWEQSKYQYMVRNLKLIYEDKINSNTIVFNQQEARSYFGNIALSGYITDTNVKKVTILSKEYPVINGVFEAIVKEREPNASLAVSYIDSKGAAVENTVKVVQLLDKPTELHNQATTVSTISKSFDKERRGNLSLGGATLVLDTLSLADNQKISISGLRYVDVPTLSPEMVNVTAEYFGYRMLPHGNLFSKSPAKIQLKYDASKFPTGYTAKDVRTFYFDTDQKKWMALEKDTLLSTSNEILSKTNHFTDFINGIVKVPESPETGSFTPTSIKDIKAADPTAGVVSIAPPTPNNMGTVTTSFPIKLPAGRSGMQPSLSVNYSSEGGNGWMGLGWDLSMPGLSIDSRWGAPRYDATNETEIYSLGGAMLTLKDGADYTNPHRKDNILRTNNLEPDGSKRFYPRIEGSYNRIIRHGDNPTNYWWEVTDKTGNKSFYGGDGSAVVDNAVIRTHDDGIFPNDPPNSNVEVDNITYWALYRTEDTNGNYVKYIYYKTQAALPGQSGDGGSEFYIKEIDYTLHNSVNQHFYKVEFIKDGDTYNDGVTSSVLHAFLDRPDKQLNARNGVVQVTKNLLKEIKIGLFDNTSNTLAPIRSYQFDYTHPIFFKERLDRISEFDANGDFFYSNTMEYEDKGDDGNPITNGSFISGQLTDLWDSVGPINGDGVNGSLLTGDFISSVISSRFSNKGSLLGTSKGSGFYGGLYVGVGACCSGGLSFTAGVNFGFSSSSSKGLVSFMDINGDGLPDKVFKEGSSLKYRANLGLPGSTVGFDDPQNITGINEISKTTSSSFSVGAQASFGVFAGYTKNKSKNTTKIYFSDVNGDGLIDLVDKGTVKFNKATTDNYLDPLFFDNQNSETINPIGAGIISQQIIDNITVETKDQLRDENPQHDIVKIWTATKDGTVTITGTATLFSHPSTAENPYPDSQDEFLGDYDGVRISIQKNTGSMNNSGTILPGMDQVLQPTFTVTGTTVSANHPSAMMSTSVYVDKGNRLYFRVQSREEGSFDRVEWNPMITYTAGDDTNVDGLEYFSSSASGGFIISADTDLIMPQPGNATLQFGISSIPALAFSDDLTFEIERGTINSATGDYQVNPIGTQPPVITITQAGGTIDPSAFNLGGSFSITENETFKFKVRSHSNVDWKAINWNPKIILTPATGPSITLNGVVDYQMYSEKINQVTSKFTINPSIPLNVKPVFNSLAIAGASAGQLPNGAHPINLVVKNSNKKVLASIEVIVNKLGGSVTYTTPTGGIGIEGIQVPTTNLTSTIFVELYTSSLKLAEMGSWGSEPVRAGLSQSSSFVTTLPTAVIPTVTCSVNNTLDAVAFDGLHDTGISCALFTYEDRSLNTVNPYLIKGNNYPLDISLNSAGSNGRAAVWLDFSRDNIVDSNEVFTSGVSSTDHNITIPIPIGIPDGNVFMRVAGGDNVSYTLADFVGNTFIGTVRDYRINVISAPTIFSKDIYCHVPNNQFGPNYRGWGQFAYHGGFYVQRTGFTSTGDGNEVILDVATHQPIILPANRFGEDLSGNIVPINETVLVPLPNGLNGCNTVACLQANNSSTASRTRFLSLSPDTADSANNFWYGSSSDVAVEAGYFSSSRLGVKNINTIYDEPPLPGSLSSTCVFPQINAVNIINRGKGSSTSFGGGFGALDLSYSISDSDNWTELNYMDLNGDRYPDILTKDKVQFTNSLGAIADTRNLSFGEVTTSASHTEGPSASGTFATAKTAGTEASLEPVEGAVNPPGVITLKEVPATQPQVKSSIGVTVSGTFGSSTEKTLWIDMNGDGLVDRVDATNGIKVKLNLGYGFANEQTWTGNGLGSYNDNYSGGAGYSSSQNGYSAGITASASEAYTTENFIDINGDGLTDLLLDGGGGNLTYRLNTGNGFMAAGSIASHISFNRGTAEGINGSFTIPINIVIIGLKLAIKVNAGGEQSLTREERAIQDINGDGYPDLLYTADGGSSTNDKELHALLSNIGKSNLLRKVNTPTGGSWEVAYKREGSTFELPQSKYVLSTIATYDGFTADNNWSKDRSVTTITYDNPHYDRREREFFGFESVRVNQHEGYNDHLDIYAVPATSITYPPIYRYTVQEYHNNNYYLKGALKKESLFAEGNPIPWTETITSYGIYPRDTAISLTELINNTIPAAGTIDAATNTFGTTFDANAIKYGDVNYMTPPPPSTGFICTDLDHSSLFVTSLATIKHFTEEGSGDKFAVTAMEAFDVHGNITQYRDYGEQNTDAYITKITYTDPSIFPSLTNAIGYPEYIRVFQSNGTTLQRERKAEYYPNGDLHQVLTTLNSSQTATVTIDYDTYGNMTKMTNDNSINSLLPTSSPLYRYFKKYTYDDVLHMYPTQVEDAFGYFSISKYNLLFGMPVYTEDMNLQPMRTRIDDRGRVVEITGPYELFVEGITGGNDPAWTIRFEYDPILHPVAISVANFDIDQYGPDAADSFNGVIDGKDRFDALLSGEATNRLHHALTRHFDSEYRTSDDSVITTNQILTATLVDGLGKPVQVKKMSAIFDDSATSPSTAVNPDTDNTLVWLLNGKTKNDAFGRAIESYYPTIQTDNFTGLTDATNGVSFVPTAAFTYDNNEDTTADPTKTTYDVLDRSLTVQLPGETDKTMMIYAIEDNKFNTTITNELGQVQKASADIRERTSSTTQESITGNITTSFEYNNIGELLRVTDVANNITESEYDLAGRRIALRHPDRGLTTFVYDAASNLTDKRTSNLLQAGGQAIHYNYTYNRLDEIVYPQFPENNVQYYYGTSGNSDASNDNAVGRLWYEVDATGNQYFKYGKLGEVTKNRRSIAVPGDRIYWFQTDWTYDTWNRVKTIQYPDEELVTYHYNRSGEMHAMTSEKNGVAGKDIISQIGYDRFGQRTYLRYGNGTEITYNYGAERRRLDHMNVGSKAIFGATADRTFVDNNYSYDVLSNVTAIHNNTVAMPGTAQIGGRSWQSFTYDDLNRMTTAAGNFVGRNDDGLTYNFHKYTLAMSYDSQHNIKTKTQIHETAISSNPTTVAVAGSWNQVEETTYGLDYQDYNTASYDVSSYQYTQPHAPRKIVVQPVLPGCCDGANDPRVKTKHYDYDANGNQTRISETICTAPEATLLRENLWDEEDRLRSIDLNPETDEVHPIAIYTYDAGGERIIKQNSSTVAIYENAQQVGTAIKPDFMLYPSGMLVARPAGDGTGAMSYTKHYFAGALRVSSKIGTTTNLGKFLDEWALQENSSGGAPINLVVASQEQLTKAETGVNHVYTAFGISPTPTFTTTNSALISVPAFETTGVEQEQFWFHPDHLGSSNYITNFVGDVSQHMEYFAFGETFVEEHKNSHNSPYKFNGKELDEESGLYYYGARYYDPKISIWASVDPLAEKFAGRSPYEYCFSNPIQLMDPDGMGPKSIIINNNTGDATYVNDGIDKVFVTNQTGYDAVTDYKKNAENGNTDAASKGLDTIKKGGYELNMDSDLGKIARTTYAEMHGVGSTNDKDRQLVAETIVNRHEQLGYSYSDLLVHGKYNAIGESEYTNPFDAVETLRTDSKYYYKKHEDEITGNLANAFSAAFKSVKHIGARIPGNPITYVSKPRPANYFDGKRLNNHYVQESIINTITGLKGIIGVWKAVRK